MSATVNGSIGKRLLDLAITLPAMVLLFPVFAMLGIVVRKMLGKPILFRQQRPGYRAKPFTMYKFRTMTLARDDEGHLLPDKDRITSFGRFMRRLSLDELPELWNVIKGDISLVGPRPLLMEYMGRYSPEQARRHEVKPGLTGWAQVNGRNGISWEDKFTYDVWYVDNWSLQLDFEILWMTLIKVIKREGINQAGHATMEKFVGTGGQGER